jgi:hypothetical protein
MRRRPVLECELRGKAQRIGCIGGNLGATLQSGLLHCGKEWMRGRTLKWGPFLTTAKTYLLYSLTVEKVNGVVTG